MTVKALPAKVKAADGGSDAGQFEAVVATYDPDSVGDQIVPGAFTKTLADWSERSKAGEPMPVVWSHNHDDPFAHIGHVTDAAETADGLTVKGQLDLENPTARQVHRLIKGGRIRNWSFAYDDLSPQKGKAADGEPNQLTELKVYEVGPTLIGANQATRTLSAKSAAAELLAEVKAGRALSAKTETKLREAVDGLKAATKALEDVLAQVTDPGQDTTNTGAAQSSGAAKAEEPHGAKAQEPSRIDPELDVLAAELSLIALSEGEAL